MATDNKLVRASSLKIAYDDLTTKIATKSDFSGSYTDLTDKPTIPTALSGLTDDSTHRLVTDSQITKWDAGAATTKMVHSQTLRSGYLTLTAKTWTDIASSTPLDIILDAGVYLVEMQAQIRGGTSGAGYVMFRPTDVGVELSGHRDSAPVYSASIYSGWNSQFIYNPSEASTCRFSFQAYGSGAHCVGDCIIKIYKLP